MTASIESTGLDQVLAGERKHVAEARQTAIPDASDGPVCGIALSGGGVRSASFALGVLQGINRWGAFPALDYMSTVSGGGYIGSALTYLRARFQPAGRPNWFPFGEPGFRGVRAMLRSGVIGPHAAAAGVLDPDRAVAFLRQHAKYLTPSNSIDTKALTAGVLRGVSASAVTYAAMSIAILSLMLQLGLLAQPHLTGGQPLVFVFDRFFLAVSLAAIALIIGFSVLLSCCTAIFTWQRRRMKNEWSLYPAMTILQASFGWVLWVVALPALVIATLPWVSAYLSYLMDQPASAPATLPALMSFLAGFAGLLWKLREFLGGERQSGSRLNVAVLLAIAFFTLYGCALLAYDLAITWNARHVELGALTGAGWPGADWPAWIGTLVGWVAAWPAFVSPLIIGLVIGFMTNVNHGAQHRMYRDRLMEAFCPNLATLQSGEWSLATEADNDAAVLGNMCRAPGGGPLQRPYHLVNTCLVVPRSPKARYRGRGGDNFIFSPRWYGSDATGWTPTDDLYGGHMTLPTAMAVSGAALNAHAGSHGKGITMTPLFSFLLTLFGLHLGYWAPNPNPWIKPFWLAPNLFFPGLRGLSGLWLHERMPYVQLSDGGHFENLGLYELVRRKLDLIIVSDATQDEGFSFEDFANAIERMRVDFGVSIRFRSPGYDLSHLIPGSAPSDDAVGANFAKKFNLAQRGFAIGTIEYPDRPCGIIIYIKSTLTKFLTGDLYGYKALNGDFPHQTTLDQFFDEAQFEAYRELGYRLTRHFFEEFFPRPTPGRTLTSKTIAATLSATLPDLLPR